MQGNGKKQGSQRAVPPELRLGAERMLGLFVNKWAVKVIHRLAISDERPGELRRQLLPVSQKVLTQTLRNLENSGFVQRQIMSHKPLNVRYSLTPLGQTFIEPLTQLCEWALKHEDELDEVTRRRGMRETSNGLRKRAAQA